MYGDIIPPKKKYREEQISDELYEVNKSIHFTPIRRAAYQQPGSKKIPIFLTLIAIIVIGFGVYHKAFNGTVIAIAPKTTRFDIQQKIPLILQSREKDSLTYSLVYVPENGSDRNPFTEAQATSTITSAASTFKDYVSMTATTTGDVMQVKLVNATAENVPLRIATRFDVNGVTYILDAATELVPTSQSELGSISTSSTLYKVIGFKGTPSYDAVYAVPVNAGSDTSLAKMEVSSSTIPPSDVLALMPEGAIALQKSTIYDRLIDQSAIVVFDERTMEEFLNATNVEVQEYFKALKPFGSSISYTITILDYTLNTSPENGKPISFSDISFEITPTIDVDLVPQQFAGFTKETMDKIQKQMSEFMSVDVSYTPFWSKTVAEVEKIKVK